MSSALDRENGGPLYLQVSDIVAKRIFDGEFEPGDNLPVEKSLCEEFGVARGTIRQALAKLEQEGLVNRERGRGTFVIEYRTPKLNDAAISGHIAFVVPYVRDSFVSTILLGLERAAADKDLSVTFKHVNNSLDEQTAALENLVSQGVLGIVLYPVDSVHTQPIDRIIQSNFPIVLVDRYLRNVATDFVTADHFGGALRATQHLIRLGHQHIGFVSWHDQAISMEHRALGYQQAILEAGLTVEKDLTCKVEGYPTVKLEPLISFLTRNKQVSAVFAANDQIALAVYQAARQVGLSIPHDIAVVGFDNLDFTDHLDVPLTTVAQPAFEIGQTAFEILLRRIRHNIDELQQVILPTTLVVRQSCGYTLQPLTASVDHEQ